MLACAAGSWAPQGTHLSISVRSATKASVRERERRTAMHGSVCRVRCRVGDRCARLANGRRLGGWPRPGQGLPGGGEHIGHSVQMYPRLGRLGAGRTETCQVACTAATDIALPVGWVPGKPLLSRSEVPPMKLVVSGDSVPEVELAPKSTITSSPGCTPVTCSVKASLEETRTPPRLRPPDSQTHQFRQQRTGRSQRWPCRRLWRRWRSRSLPTRGAGPTLRLIQPLGMHPPIAVAAKTYWVPLRDAQLLTVAVAVLLSAPPVRNEAGRGVGAGNAPDQWSRSASRDIGGDPCASTSS